MQLMPLLTKGFSTSFPLCACCSSTCDRSLSRRVEYLCMHVCMCVCERARAIQGQTFIAARDMSVEELDQKERRGKT